MVAGHAGDCKQGCTASSQPAIAEDLHPLGLEEVLETAGVPNLEAAASASWVDMESRCTAFSGFTCFTVQINKLCITTVYSQLTLSSC